ncbi:TAP-like protein-domain-containing protein, partial [Lasiosphaeria miniovina]
QQITPSAELEWQPCYDFINPLLQCARLTVPLDYNHPQAQSCISPKVHIALLLLPAKNANTTSVRSPMLINPGGPGGSGVLLALSLAPEFQTIFGEDQPIIGFDPRGIGYTTPQADCWATPPPCDGCPEDTGKGLGHRLEWLNMNAVFGGVNSSNIALKYLEAGQRAVNDMCREKDSQLDGQSIFGHASTAHVARDMISIVDAWERRADKDQHAAAAENPTKGKLVYWGFSYGTYLGATFASMFPDRVGRLLLDGVVDAELYPTPMWRDSLVDTDKILGEFFRLCAEVGTKCKLYRDGDTSADVEHRYYSIFDGLSANPITFTHPDSFFPVIIRASFIKTLVFSIMYSPAQLFPLLGILLDFLYERQHEQLAALFQDPQLHCLLPGNALTGLLTDAQRAIMCSDKIRPVNMTLDEIRSEFEAVAETSQFADIWTGIMLQCNNWDIAKPHRVASESTLLQAVRGSKIETAFPILFLSNTYDPVTPLVAAVKMALAFKDAGLLEQKAYGHCTISSASLCTALAVRDYVLHGKVPPPPVVHGKDYLAGRWTTCEADQTPWRQYNPAATASVSAVDEADARDKQRLLEAFRSVQQAHADVQKWTGGGHDINSLLIRLARSDVV